MRDAEPLQEHLGEVGNSLWIPSSARRED